MHVRTEDFRYDDGAVGLLVVFQDGGNGTAYGEAGAVEGMDVFRFVLRRAAEADIGTASLEIFRVGTRRDFAVFALRREPYFDVEGLSSGEANVAGAEANDVVRQAEGFQDVFGVVRHLVQFFIARFRSGEFDHFYLVELVLTDETARVAAGRACFGAEARRHRRQVNRQLGAVDDFAAIVVGQGHFSRRDHVHFFAFDVQAVHVFVEFRQLARADHGVAVDDVRRDDFGVAVFIDVLVEHEVVYGPFEARAEADVVIEPCARRLRRPFGVEDAQVFAYVPVIEGFKVEFPGFRLRPSD